MKQIGIVLALVLPALAVGAPPVQVCDNGNECVTVTGGALDVNATVNATANTVATATAAAPSCTEGQTDCPLSVDLTGNLRTLATSTSAATATAAAPSYSEGTANPISQDLAGRLRILMPPLVAGTAQIGHVISDPTSVATIYGAAKGATGSASATVTEAGANRNSLDVILRDSSGAEVTTFGATNASVSATGAAVPASATYAGVLSGGNLVGMAQPVTDTQLRATAVSTSDNHSTATTYLAVRITDGTDFVATDNVADNSAATATNALVLPGVVETSTTPPTSTDSYRAALALDSDRKTYVRTYDWDPLSANSGLSTATTLTELVAAPGSGVSIYVTDITFSSTVAATATTDQQMLLKRGTGTACGTGTAIVWGGFNQANSGAVVTRSQPLKIAANEALCWMHAATGSKIVEVGYFLAP